MENWFAESKAAEGRRERRSAKQICELVRAGDALAWRAVEREGRYLGWGSPIW